MHNLNQTLTQLSQEFPPSNRNLHLEQEEEEEIAAEVVSKEEAGAEAGEHPQATKASNNNHLHLLMLYHLAVQNTGYLHQQRRPNVYKPTMDVHAVTFVVCVVIHILPVGIAGKMSRMAKNGTSILRGVSYYLKRQIPTDIQPIRGLKQQQQPL